MDLKQISTRNWQVILIAGLCLSVIAPQAFAAKPAKASKVAPPAKMAHSNKERLVLMPLRVGEADKSLQGAMETALVEGLQQKYEVFSGEQVAQKAKEIFLKESRSVAVKKDCDETRCMQNIAEAFQAELIATTNVTKQDGTYFLSLKVENIFDNKVVNAKSEPCEHCTAVQVVNKLKELSGTAVNPADIERQLRDAEASQKANEGKLKAEQLRQDALSAEQRQREKDSAEYKKLLAAKAADDKRLAELKAQADVRRNNAEPQMTGDFPTLQSAVTEIKRLNEKIRAIETGYEKELAQTRKQVSQRYAAQLAALNKAHKDEFETATEFKAKQDKQRHELNSQRDAELARLNVADLAAAEIALLRDSIQKLEAREYLFGAESLTAELGAYDAEAQQFSFSMHSKIPSIKLAMNGSIPLPAADAKAFKQQWGAGLVHHEARVKPGSETMELALVNDADNSRLNNEGGLFMTAQAKENFYRPAMVRIPGKNYEMGKYHVTKGEFAKFVRETGYATGNECYLWDGSKWDKRSGRNWRNPNFSQDDSHPVTCVNWNDAQAYTQWLSRKTGRQYRLPIESEWEYACYGGAGGFFSSPDYCGGDNIDAVAWYNGNSGGKTHPVGQKQANGYGLYDMSGNLWEWMENKYDDKNDWRALRGGSWGNSPQLVRVPYRYGVDPAGRGNNGGFRLARTLP